LLRLPAAQFEIDGHTVLGFEERILGAGGLDRLVEAVTGLRAALSWSAVPA